MFDTTNQTFPIRKGCLAWTLLSVLYIVLCCWLWVLQKQFPFNQGRGLFHTITQYIVLESFYTFLYRIWLWRVFKNKNVTSLFYSFWSFRYSPESIPLIPGQSTLLNHEVLSNTRVLHSTLRRAYLCCSTQRFICPASTHYCFLSNNRHSLSQHVHQSARYYIVDSARGVSLCLCATVRVRSIQARRRMKV